MELQGKIKLKTLKNYFNIMQGLTDEMIIAVSKEGLSSTTVDPGHAAMARVMLNAGTFEEYTGTEGEFAIDVNKAMGFIALGKEEDIVSIGIVESSFSITIGYLTRMIRLLDMEQMPRPKLDKVDYDSHVTLRCADFGNGVKAGTSVTSAIKLSLTSTGFGMRGEGDMDTVKMELPKDLLIECVAPEDVSAMYSLDYLTTMSKALYMDQFTLYLKTGQPLKAMHSDEHMDIEYMLAPRIDD